MLLLDATCYIELTAVILLKFFRDNNLAKKNRDNKLLQYLIIITISRYQAIILAIERYCVTLLVDGPAYALKQSKNIGSFF